MPPNDQLVDSLFVKPNIHDDNNGKHGRMATSFPVRLGRRLSAVRQERGLSQTQLADLADIGRAHLSQIENGAVAARIDTLYAIAGALGLTLSNLLKDF
jgi:DNA-binding XRE family transcriptional regulator